MDAAAYNKQQYFTGALTGEHITELARFWQAQHQLEVDGKAGPNTIKQIDGVIRAMNLTTNTAHFPLLVERWRPAVEEQLAVLRQSTVPFTDPFNLLNKGTDFLLKWIEIESGGLPKATGIIRNGFHVEAGLGQLYFETPQSVQFGATSADLFDDNEPRDPGKQISSLVQMALAYSRTADQELKRYSLTWSARDNYRLTKLVHALPALLHYTSARPRDYAAMALAVKRLTRDELLSSLRPFYGEPIARCFANAEATGSVIG